MTLKGDLLTRYLLAPARRMQRVAFQALIDDLLHTAIETHNEKAVVKLLEVKFVVFKLNSQSLEASMLKWFSGAGADD